MWEWLIQKFRVQIYNVGIIYKPIKEVFAAGLDNSDIIWLKGKKKDRFYADPFLWNEDNNFYYILVEIYYFWEEKGKIALLKILKSTFELVEEKLVINEEYHLSFPMCNYKGDYIIPESSKGNGTYKYKINSRCEVVGKDRISDDGIIDGIEWKDGDYHYIIGTTKDEPLRLLRKWSVDINGMYVEKEIIKNDIATARNAGRLFESEGCLFRPAQNCKNRYGEFISIMKINEKNGQDRLYCEVRCPSHQYNETMHTFNVYENCIIIDGSKDFVRFPIKLFYKLSSSLKRRKIGK